MNTNLNHFILSGICLFALTLLSSCSNAPAPTPGGNPGELNPPSQVTVARENSGLLVSWSGATGAEAYQILRKDGECDFIGIAGLNQPITGTSWTDTDYPENKVIQYKVISCCPNKPPSPPSQPSNPVSEQVLDLEASVMAYADQIVLRWSAHPERPDFYRIRRSTVKSDLNGQIIAEVTTNRYSDKTGNPTNPPAADTPYYYRVTWVKSGIEYGKGAQAVLGLFSSNIDPFEPNDQLVKAAVLIKGLASTAYTYAFDESLGECAADPDWYLYQKSGAGQEALTVELKYPSESLLLGKLRLQAFDLNGHPREEQLLINEENLCICLLEESDTGLYLKIEPDGALGNEGIGAYTITLK